MNKRALALLALLVPLLVGCAVNPVTGKQELRLISEAGEIAIGKEHYLTSQQSQGGAYGLDPELTAYVAEVGRRLVAASDRPQLPYEFVVLNNSVPNAWALPGGKIAINRGLLLELNSEAELAAVLGHEIVHAAARHGAKGQERGILFQVALLGVGGAVKDNDNSALIVGAAGVGAGMLNVKYGRDAELESDHYGIKYMVKAGYDPAAAVDLQETFVRLSGGKAPSWLEGLFSTHPPSRERVDANRALAARYGVAGERGTERYQVRIAHLKATKAAYAAADSGRAALGRGDGEKALKLADAAIAVEPREALFYGLKGDAELERGRHRQAIAFYDEAIRRNEDYFAFYLQRGLAKDKLGQRGAAQQDLKRSVELLPTDAAHNALGLLAMHDDRSDDAFAHFQAASGSNSTTGRQAGAAAAQLQVRRDPGRLIAVRLGNDAAGRLLVMVENAATVAVHDVVIVVSAAGVSRSIALSTLDSGQRSRHALDLTVPAKQAKAKINRARADGPLALR
jgi:predicted Zn-dependent protease